MDWKINGHEWAVDLLSGQIARGEVRHAYLFCGPQGVGRRTLALRFAQALCCQNAPAPGALCLQCRTCRHIEKMEHTDLKVLVQQEDKTQIAVQQVHQVRHDLSLTPFESKYKIALLLGFEAASDDAQNALLKTLEEPPSQAVLLIVCPSPDDILPTVLSRCEVLRLRPQPPARLAQALAASTGRDEPGRELHLAARLADGCTGRARRLLETRDWQAQRQEQLSAAFEIFSLSRRQRLALAAEMFTGNKREKSDAEPGEDGASSAAASSRKPARKGQAQAGPDGKDLQRRDQNPDREAMRRALTVWISVWRDILLCTAGLLPPELSESPDWELATPLVNLDAAGQIARIARQVGFNQARQQLERLEAALVRLHPPYHANPRLLGEVLLLDWPVL